MVYIAGNDMPTDALTQIIDRLRIAGSSTMLLVVPNVELSPRDRYSYENCTNFVVLIGIKISADFLIANFV